MNFKKRLFFDKKESEEIYEENLK